MARKWHAQPMDAKKEERMSVEVNCFFQPMHKVLREGAIFYHILEWKSKILVKPMPMVMKQISAEHKSGLA